MSKKGWRLVGVAAGLAGALVVLGLLNEETDLAVFGVTVSAWILGIALYVLGVLAGVGAARGDKG